MVTENDMYELQVEQIQPPIYEILVFDNPNKELVSRDGKNMGCPDMGDTFTVGFYYDVESAIQALNENRCDLRETCYNAAFILCRFPGLYNVATSSERMYFVWDEERQGFFQTEEPKIFKHTAL